jgi:hypothetical protein
MKLINCKRCKKQVADDAKTCPHCGVKNPGVKDEKIQPFTVLIVLIGVIYFGFRNSEPPEKNTPETASVASSTIEQNSISQIEDLSESEIPAKPVPSNFNNNDPHLIKQLNQHLEKIESAAIKERKKLDKLMLAAVSSKDTSPATANKRGEILVKIVTKITDTLHTSMDVSTPDIQNNLAKQHISKAIEAHKQWAVSQQGRMAALLQFNSEAMEKFDSESRHYAEIEGYSLVLADEAIKDPGK